MSFEMPGYFLFEFLAMGDPLICALLVRSSLPNPRARDVGCRD